MDTMAIPQESDASWGVLYLLKNLSLSVASLPFAVVEKAAEQEESFPTKDVMRIVDISVANMDAGRLSEPINAEVNHYLKLLADELDEDW